jgi:hypothetical protein
MVTIWLSAGAVHYGIRVRHLLWVVFILFLFRTWLVIVVVRVATVWVILRLKGTLLAVIALVASKDLKLGLVTVLLLLWKIVRMEFIKHGLGRVASSRSTVRAKYDWPAWLVLLKKVTRSLWCKELGNLRVASGLGVWCVNQRIHFTLLMYCLIPGETISTCNSASDHNGRVKLFLRGRWVQDIDTRRHFAFFRARRSSQRKNRATDLPLVLIINLREMMIP